MYLCDGKVCYLSTDWGKNKQKTFKETTGSRERERVSATGLSGSKESGRKEVDMTVVDEGRERREDGQ